MADLGCSSAVSKEFQGEQEPAKDTPMLKSGDVRVSE